MRRAGMPSARFSLKGDVVTDTATGLVWPLNAQPAETGLSWAEAFGFIESMNRENRFGHSDWRLPNRRELYSLVDHAEREPALPQDHPFERVWAGRYWTSTTSARDYSYAWWVQFSGGRMFFGRKADDAVVWPVRGTSATLWATGQKGCHDVNGAPMDCAGTGQDGALRMGLAWPEPRFREIGGDIEDRLTGFVWQRRADLAGRMVDRETAGRIVAEEAERTGQPWRLPAIMELESLADCSRADPALPADHPFENVREAYWSATDSGYDPEWSFCFYMHKGAVGVGFKTRPEFHVWAVRTA